MTNTNRKIGTGFEKELCLSLYGYGFWAHNLAQNSQGQPFDVIAAKNGHTYPIAKCVRKTFSVWNGWRKISIPQ